MEKKSYIVSVIGTGELGSRIAGELSLLGIQVKVFDNNMEKLNQINFVIDNQKQGLVKNGLLHPNCETPGIIICRSLREAVTDVDFVFETVVDKLEIKQWLFEKITHNCLSDTIVCSSTLNFSIEDISDLSVFKERIIGCRFLMPVYRIPLVELTYTKYLSTHSLQKVKDLMKQYGKNIIIKMPGDEPRMLTCKESNRYWNDYRNTVGKKYPPPFNKRDTKMLDTHDGPYVGSNSHLVGYVAPIYSNTTLHENIPKHVYSGERDYGQQYDKMDGVKLSEEKKIPINSYSVESNYDILSQQEQTEIKQNNKFDDYLIEGLDTVNYFLDNLNIVDKHIGLDFGAKTHATKQSDVLEGVLLDDENDNHGNNSGHGRNSVLTNQTNQRNLGCIIPENNPLRDRDILSGILTDNMQDGNHGSNTGHGQTRSGGHSMSGDVNSIIEEIAAKNKTAKITTTKMNQESEMRIPDEKTKMTECVVCQEEKINAVLDPCGHMWMCFQCALKMQKLQKGCPACRSHIEKILRVFLP